MTNEKPWAPLVVGRRIRAIRKAEDPPLSQAKFAERIGVSAGAVGNWEQGLSRPEEENIDAICREFSVTSDYIIFGKTFGLMHGVASNLARAERRLSKT